MQQKENIEKALKEKSYLEIGDVLTKSFEIYKKTWGVTAFGLLIGAIFVLIAMFTFMTLVLGFNFSDFDPLDFATQMQGESTFIAFSLLGLIFQGLFAPLTAGFIKICKNVKEQKAINLGVAFSYFQSKYLGNLIMAGVIIGVLASLISYVNQFILYLPLLNYVTNLLITTLTVFVIPIIIFKDLGVMQAIEYSLKLVAKNFFIILVIVLLATILGYLGAILCGIGILFSMPIIYAAQFCIYDETIGEDEVSEIDMIGNSDVDN